jgi:uncharacterized protein YfbU (UPF0304 family)
MKLTPAERWILANQYRLLQLLSSSPIPLYEHAITILERGYEDQYKYAAQYLQEDPFPQEIASEVKDILQMFSEIQWIREKLSDSAVTNSPRLEFWGFNGNNNPEHNSYATFLHQLGNYRELANRPEWNSHGNNIELYRAMVRSWKALPRKGLQLTEEDVRTIVDAPVRERIVPR